MFSYEQIEKEREADRQTVGGWRGGGGEGKVNGGRRGGIRV